MTITTLTTSATVIREDDLMQHIQDTPLFWVFRNGRQLQRSWNELTATEKAQQIEAAARASYVQTFDIY